MKIYNFINIKLFFYNQTPKSTPHPTLEQLPVSQIKPEQYTQFDSCCHRPHIQNTHVTLLLNIAECAIIFRHPRMFNSTKFAPNQIQSSQKLWFIYNRLKLDKMKLLQNIATICHSPSKTEHLFQFQTTNKREAQI